MQIFENTVPGGFEPPISAPSHPLPPSPSFDIPRAPSGPINRHLVFTGDGEEYFKIWAVNLGLTILTLGIYSAWAKVRRLRYFYGNTLFANSSFEFHGSPTAILRGRIIALVLLVLYSRSAHISLYLYGATLVLLLAIFPWLYWRSLRFRLGNTSWRGVRFHFAGSLKDAYLCLFPGVALFAGINAATVAYSLNGDKSPSVRLGALIGGLYLVLLLAAPYFYHRIRAYQHANSRLGNVAFTYHGQLRQIYALAGWIALAVGPFFGTAIGIAAWMMWKHRGAIQAALAAPTAIAVLAAVVGYLVLLLSIPLVSARAQNVVWGATRLNDVPIHSNLSPSHLLGVEVINWVANGFSLHLFRPFAAIRTLRARLPVITYAGDPDVFVATEGASSGAVGEEVADLFGFDIAL